MQNKHKKIHFKVDQLAGRGEGGRQLVQKINFSLFFKAPLIIVHRNYYLGHKQVLHL